jgi:hypothetical protein
MCFHAYEHQSREYQCVSGLFSFIFHTLLDIFSLSIMRFLFDRRLIVHPSIAINFQEFAEVGKWLNGYCVVNRRAPMGLCLFNATTVDMTEGVYAEVSSSNLWRSSENQGNGTTD